MDFQTVIQDKIKIQLGTLVLEILAKEAQIELLEKELAELKSASEVKPNVEGNVKLPRPKAV